MNIYDTVTASALALAAAALYYIQSATATQLTAVIALLAMCIIVLAYGVSKNRSPSVQSHNTAVSASQVAAQPQEAEISRSEISAPVLDAQANSGVKYGAKEGDGAWAEAATPPPLPYEEHFAFSTSAYLPPEKATLHSAGYDLYASDTIEIPPHVTAVVNTGVRLVPRKGRMPPPSLVFARSGLAAKNNIGLMNGVGLIDSDYQGEIKVILHNYGDKPFNVVRGMRIAQLVPFWSAASTVAASNGVIRGEGGLGSTGV